MDKVFAGIIGAVIIGSGVLLIISDVQLEFTDSEKKIVVSEETLREEIRWIKSGPFWIDKQTYDVGETVFVRINDLPKDTKGNMIILRELNSTHYTVWKTEPFDGGKKSSYNFYFTPRLSVHTDLCEIEDIIGNWRLVFTNTQYSNIEFKFTENILAGEEDLAEMKVC